MSTSNAKPFIKALMTDGELLRELQERHDLDPSEDPDEETIRGTMGNLVPELAAEHGYDFTAEEGFEALGEIQGSVEPEELSDLELEQVAGGKSDSMKRKLGISIGTMGVGCAIESAHDASFGNAEQCMD